MMMGDDDDDDDPAVDSWASVSMYTTALNHDRVNGYNNERETFEAVAASQKPSGFIFVDSCTLLTIHKGLGVLTFDVNGAMANPFRAVAGAMGLLYDERRRVVYFIDDGSSRSSRV